MNLASSEVDPEGGGHRGEGDTRAGDQRLEEHVTGACKRAGAAGGGMEAGVDERAAGSDGAREALLAEGAPSSERDARGGGGVLVARLEGCLQSAQLVRGHAGHLMIACARDQGW